MCVGVYAAAVLNTPEYTVKTMFFNILSLTKPKHIFNYDHDVAVILKNFPIPDIYVLIP